MRFTAHRTHCWLWGDSIFGRAMRGRSVHAILRLRTCRLQWVCALRGSPSGPSKSACSPRFAVACSAVVCCTTRATICCRCYFSNPRSHSTTASNRGSAAGTDGKSRLPYLLELVRVRNPTPSRPSDWSRPGTGGLRDLGESGYIYHGTVIESKRACLLGC
ncbi:hypothetical protein BCR34DRAFT_349707 [Clohesyomyces aquaticus]|uniref:Uncharacterized protein n=1 Tax=Clohesyomyces aquaticus TaxID=1231657 RepID=A0A1Y1ZKN8_9PLEO|nr:hypothetical protein BCR34DRAFT_349707 [Clohesyomyces aquaticus]